jgi:hypothetical protein
MLLLVANDALGLFSSCAPAALSVNGKLKQEGR